MDNNIISQRSLCIVFTLETGAVVVVVGADGEVVVVGAAWVYRPASCRLSSSTIKSLAQFPLIALSLISHQWKINVAEKCVLEMFVNMKGVLCLVMAFTLGALL